LQDPENRPARAGRPSLLSPEQQAEAERHRILGTLDGQSAAAAPAKAKGRGLWWGAAGLGVIAVAAGALAWSGAESDDKALASADSAAKAAPKAVPQPSTPIVAAASEPAAPQAAPEVSTAAILNDVPPPDGKLPSMKEMLGAPSASSAPASGSPPGDLAQALERPSAAPQRQAAHKAEHKPAHASETPRLAQKAAPEHKAKLAEKPKYKPTPQDNDVTLLAALMAHMQTPAGRKADGPAAQLRQCKLQNAAGEEQCRARLCAGVAKNEAECKAPPIAKAGADS